MVIPSLRTMFIRFELLKELEDRVLQSARLSPDLVHGVPHPTPESFLSDYVDEYTPFEAEYIAHYVQLLFETLAVMFADDPAHVARLETARRRFFAIMDAEARQARQEGCRVSHPLRILSWCLAGALPPEMLEIDDWDHGPWFESFDELLARWEEQQKEWEKEEEPQ